MRVLFLHDAFPGQYRHLAAALAADPANRVLFATRAAGGEDLPDVERVLYRPHRAPRAQVHPYLRWMEAAVLDGQAVYRLCAELKAGGFTPDIVCAHSGWGPSLYVKEAFPACRLLSYVEWYYHTRNSDADFLGDPLDPDQACALRTRNASILLDLAQCDAAITPTAFQRDRFPAVLRDRLTVLHDGIDTDFFAPKPQAGGLVLPGLDLSGAREIVTYATRGMEPYRGFPQFMRAVARLQCSRPHLHAVIAGENHVYYGRWPEGGGGWKERMLAELPELDLSRLHFTGPLAYGDYLKLLQASSVHVYLTVPFVLSWSLLEAMAAGCLIVGSDTEPVREIVTDGQNGLLADFHSPGNLAARIAEALDSRTAGAALRAAARAAILDRYDLKTLLPRHLRLVRETACRTDGL